MYGILGPLGFDFFLIGLCTFYAVNTRNVPANFNEAKFIGFCMYVTCVIWIAFVPLYFGSSSKVRQRFILRYKATSGSGCTLELGITHLTIVFM